MTDTMSEWIVSEYYIIETIQWYRADSFRIILFAPETPGPNSITPGSILYTVTIPVVIGPKLHAVGLV